MLVLVTGASGALGRRVVRLLAARGHEIRAASRRPPSDTDSATTWMKLDLAIGTGLVAATEGVEAVVHCATDLRRHRQVDLAGTARLCQVLSGQTAHLVFPGVVGSDVIPLRYYQSKTAAEEEITASGLD